MKRVVFVVDHLKGGGAELMVLNLAKMLKKIGMQVTIITLNKTNNYADETTVYNIITINFPIAWTSGKLLVDRPVYAQPEMDKLNNAIKDINPDAVIVTIWYAFLLLPYIEHHNIWAWSQADILPEFQGTLNPIKYFRNRYKTKIFKNKFKEIFNHANIITVNDEIRVKYLALLDSKNIVTITNGIEISPALIHAAEKHWEVVFVGRLSPTKQVEHAIKAFKKANLQGKMLIVGEGPREAKLKNLVNKLGLDRQVIFKGWLDKQEVSLLVQQSKALVLPSRTEGFPLVVGEALVQGTPVVAYDCSEGIHRQLYTEDMKRGLVEPDNIDELARTLADIIQRPYAIPIDIAERYDLTTMANKFISVISV